MNLINKINKKFRYYFSFLFIVITVAFLVGCGSKNMKTEKMTISENMLTSESYTSENNEGKIEESVIIEKVEEEISTVEAVIEELSSYEIIEEKELVTEINVETGENTFLDEEMEETLEKHNLSEHAETVEAVEDREVDIEEEDVELTSVQRNSLNMLNYITVLTQKINESKESRIYLESVCSSLTDNIYPNAVDTKTQTQINSIIDTINEYRMISVKRERLEYIYEQNRAQALRQAVPNPLGLLSSVHSKNILENVASVLYMAVDSSASYKTAATQAELKYLEEGWELDDAEDAALRNSQKATFNYMINMVRDNDFPGEYALNNNSVDDFVKWTNEDNLVRKIAWLESNEETYKEFRTYWLELAKSYYESKDYKKCLEALSQYEEVATRIFRKDYDYAEILPMGIVAAKETMIKDEYVKFADKYARIILENCDNDEWILHYFVAQVYIELYSITKDDDYLDKAYSIAFDNVNILVDEQKMLNASYLADVVEEEVDKKASKREKKEVKQYNKMLKEERKVELPPVSEALYLNCDLLFALANECNISDEEKKDIDAILHGNGECIFLTKALDDRFWFNNSEAEINSEEIDVEFNGKELVIPATCVTNRSSITVSITSKNGNIIIDDWTVVQVTRPKEADCTEFMVKLTSEKGKDYKYQEGEKITISVLPVEDSPENVIEFSYDVITTKKLFVVKEIEFKRNTK